MTLITPANYRKAADGIYKRAAMPCEIKDVDINKRILTAYYSAFGNKDSDGDIGTPGMTLKSIAETGPSSAQPRIKYFLNHDVTHPLGTHKELGEDAHGPWYRAEAGAHAFGVDFLKMVDSGVITEHSYGLSVVRRDKSVNAKMLEVKVWEVSPLTHWGANPLTPFIDIGKSMTREDEISYFQKKMDSLEKFCRNTDATDETIQSLLLEIKYLTAHIINLTTTTAAAEKAQETPGTQDDYSELLNSIKSIKLC